MGLRDDIIALHSTRHDAVGAVDGESNLFARRVTSELDSIWQAIALLAAEAAGDDERIAFVERL